MHPRHCHKNITGAAKDPQVGALLRGYPVVPQQVVPRLHFLQVWCSGLQWVAVCCSVLHCVAVCRSVSQGVAVCRSVCRSRNAVALGVGVTTSVFRLRAVRLRHTETTAAVWQEEGTCNITHVRNSCNISPVCNAMQFLTCT